MKRPPGSFFTVPRRLTDAVERREVSPQEFGLAVFILGKIDERRTREYVATLNALRETYGFKQSADYLWKLLHRLREKGFVEFESQPGQRAPYVFRASTSDTTSDRTSDSDGRPRSEVDPGLDLRLTPDSESPRSRFGSGIDLGFDLRRDLEVLARARSDGDVDVDVDVDEEPTELTPAVALASAAGALDGEALEALGALVDDLDDADERTLGTYATNFDRLVAEDFREARRRLLCYRERPDVAIRSEAAYVFEVLNDIAVYGRGEP